MNIKAENIIEIRVNEIAQLFHTLDPFPFREKDLDREAEDYIVGWARGRNRHGVTERFGEKRGTVGYGHGKRVAWRGERTWSDRDIFDRQHSAHFLDRGLEPRL